MLGNNIDNSIEEMLPSENTTLFLYALLHIHPSFIDFLTSSRCIESVFCGILHGLYDSSNAACIDHLYILVTNVLVVVQDKMLRQSLSHMKAIKAPWYVEHKLIDTSVADLTMLCTLRCTLHALFKLKDSYLLSNCFAVMIDLAPVLQEIDIYVSERIVKVIYQLAKRSILSDSASASTTTTPSEADVMSSYLLGDVSIAINSRETLGVLLKVCALALHPSKRSRNVHLLYALIHEYEKLKSVLKSDVDTSDLAGAGGDSFVLMAFMQQKELLAMTKHYLDKLNLDKESSYSSAVDAVNALRSVLEEEEENSSVEEGPKRGVNFSYTEEDNADAFFVPCVWASMVRVNEEIDFNMRDTTLFSPIEKRLLRIK